MTCKPHDYRFLVDVNLPKFFKFFNAENYFHVVDLNPKMTDQEIWDYALENDLIILKNDSDFYYRFTTCEICPKVIYFRLGNFTLQELHHYFITNWDQIVNHLNKASLIVAYKTHFKTLF